MLRWEEGLPTTMSLFFNVIFILTVWLESVSSWPEVSQHFSADSVDVAFLTPV